MKNILIAMFGKNEVENISYAISFKNLTSDFVYIDSSENQKVSNILEEKNINIIKTEFVSWSQLRNVAYEYAKKNNYKWILVLDADEYIKKGVWEYLNSIDLEKYDAYYCNFNFYYCQTKLKFCKHRDRIRLVSVKKTNFESNKNVEWVKCNNSMKLKKFTIVNNDLKPFSFQIKKQLEKSFVIENDVDNENNEHFKLKSIILKLIGKNSFFKAFLYFIYHFFFRLGFLDGKAGFYYCFNYAFLYHILKYGYSKYEIK